MDGPQPPPGWDEAPHPAEQEDAAPAATVAGSTAPSPPAPPPVAGPAEAAQTAAAPSGGASRPAPGTDDGELLPWERRAARRGNAASTPVDPSPTAHPAQASSTAAPDAAAPSAAMPAATPPATPPAGEGPPAAAGGAVPPPADDGDDGPPPPADEGPAVCDDARWRGFVEAVGAAQPRLASKLRRAELAQLTADGARAIPADAANVPAADELAAAAPLLREAFGDAFQLQIADATTEKAREAHTIAGRNRIVAAQQLAARRDAARNDAQVQRLLRFFPNGRVVNIALSEAEPGEAESSNGSEDV